jgi:hypothetical protein
MTPSSSAYTSNSQPIASSIFRHNTTRYSTSTRVLLFQFIEFLLKNRHLLGLFQQHGKQSTLEWQQRLRLSDGGDVPARGGKETIEDILITPAQVRRNAEGWLRSRSTTG